MAQAPNLIPATFSISLGLGFHNYNEVGAGGGNTTISSYKILVEIHKLIHGESLRLSLVHRQCSMNVRYWVNSY